jgi:hypothetical protein
MEDSLFGSETLFSKSKDRKPGDARISPERRNWVRRESAMIMSRNIVLRERTKVKASSESSEKLRMLTYARKQQMDKWVDKSKTSPFAVDLAAEDERVREEATIRTYENMTAKIKLEERQKAAKNEIVLRALSEFSDLEALRKEKRAIIEEEQRLRALLTLEKTSHSTKADRLAAERAQRQRGRAKLVDRRRAYKESMSTMVEEEQDALRAKFGLPSRHARPNFQVKVLPRPKGIADKGDI